MTIDLWLVSTDLREADCRQFLPLLKQDEKERANRFRFERDRVRSIVTRACLRLLLSSFVSCAAADIRLVCNRYGKPKIAEPSWAAATHFNVSHSGDFAAIAITRTGPIGVDIEQVKPDLVSKQLAGTVLDESEISWLAQHSPEQRNGAFYRLWTIKESVLKAVGLGFSLDPRRLHSMITPENIEVWLDASRSRAWRVVEPAAPEGYRAAVAFDGSVHARIAVRNIDFREQFSGYSLVEIIKDATQPCVPGSG